tara:strand:- start:36065 stop:36805 length:741 start_codon:yes stop_codon:yes gene_type:complete
MSKQRTNNPGSITDPDFNLDEYLSEQADQNYQQKNDDQEVETTSFSRNLILICALSAAAFLWYFDWSPRNVYNFFFADEVTTSTRVGGFNIQIPPINVDIPEIDIDIPEIRVGEAQTGTSNLGISFTDYMAELNDLGYLDQFGSSSLSTLYSNSVPVEYIDGLGKAGILANFGGTSISTLYSNKVPSSFIEELSKEGLMDNFGSTSISRLYTNNVPISFIKILEDRGLLDNMSSQSVVDAYKLDGE